MRQLFQHGGSVILMSSPKGTGNTFHQIFESAKLNENGFNCRFGTYVNPLDSNEVYTDRFMWWVHPEHDLLWFQNETKDKSPRDINQEFLCNFNASGDTFIFHEDISRMERNIKEPIEIYHAERNVWIWEKPANTGLYLISCDVSRGDARDYSAFHVIRVDCHPIRQVAEFKGKIRPDQLGILLMQISKIFNNATVAPENNSGWSGQTILKMEEAQFPFIYYSRKRKPKDRDAGPVDPYYAMNRNDFLPGYSITSANRLQMLAKLEQYIRLGDVELHSSRLVDEIKTFVMGEGSRPEAMRGYHDDLVMALAGGLWIREEAYMYSHRSDDVAKAMINSMSISSNKTNQFIDFNRNASLHDRARIQEHMNQENKIKMASGDILDMNWLLRNNSIIKG